MTEVKSNISKEHESTFPIGWIKLTEQYFKFSSDKPSDKPFDKPFDKPSDKKTEFNTKYDSCFLTFENCDAEENVICPNCTKINFVNFATYNDDVYIQCECHNSYTPLHTPQNFESIEWDATDYKKINDSMDPKYNFHFDARNFINDEGRINYYTYFKNDNERFKGDDELTKQKISEMSKFHMDDGHLSSYFPNYHGCFQLLNIDDSQIYDHVHQRILQLKQKFKNIKDYGKDRDLYTKGLENEPINLISKMGIIRIEEFGEESTFIRVIHMKLKSHFGITCIESYDINHLCYLPIALPILREKVANYFPEQLEKYDNLLRLIKPYWHFHESENRQGYTKLLFELVKFFGFNPYTVANIDKLQPFEIQNAIYNGICNCCGFRVYGIMSAD